METKEALRVALACMIDTHRGLPKATKTKKRVRDAIQIVTTLVIDDILPKVAK